MSTWTHVVGAIRFDGIPKSTVRSFQIHAIDRTMKGEIEVTDRGHIVPLASQRKIPCGSEGPLQYHIHQYATGLPWVVVPIWGDLRDYDNANEIKEWFSATCKSYPLVRDGVLHIQVSTNAPVIVYFEANKIDISDEQSDDQMKDSA